MKRLLGRVAKPWAGLGLLVLLAPVCGQSAGSQDNGDKPAVAQAVARGLASGFSLETIFRQELQKGADFCELLQAGLAQGADLTRAFAFLLKQARAQPEFGQRCSGCELLKCSVKAGVDRVAAANALMSAGAELEEVRACLAALGYGEAETYTYAPPDPPAALMTQGPTFPGGGGGIVNPPVVSPAQ